MTYPPVLTEDATLDAARAGLSLARIGDGELKLATGRSIKAQRWNPQIGEALREVCAGAPGPCLAAIPRLSGGYEPPRERGGYIRFCREPIHTALYGPGPYGSSFITRPDCAPHIDSPEFWAKVRSLWTGRDVILVRGSGKSLTPRDLGAAAGFTEITPPPVEAWDHYPELFARLRRSSRPVLLCLGAVGTVLAWRLAAEGVHAIDLGGVGRFMRASRHAPLP